MQQQMSLLSFDKLNHWLDNFYFSSNIVVYSKLTIVFKMILCLFHGQAAIECGFV